MAKTPCSECREPRFDPWLGNEILYAAKTQCNQINKLFFFFFIKKAMFIVTLTGHLLASQLTLVQQWVMEDALSRSPL